MSEICIFNIKEHDCDFDELNSLAKRLISYALDKDLAIFFNNDCYGRELIRSAKMKNYFLMSDSFIYQNCDFLSLDYSESCRINTIESFESKYYFFRDIVKLLLENKVNTLEIYISSEVLPNECDFSVKNSSSRTLMQNMFDDVFSGEANGNYFPPVKYVLKD